MCCFLSYILYLQTPKTILFLAISFAQKQCCKKILERVQNLYLDLIGNRRCDSPRFNTKYGMYSLINAHNNEIVDCHVVHLTVAANSVRMEKIGLSTLLPKLQKYRSFQKVSYDQQTSADKRYMSKEQPDIIHQFDKWHVGKSIKKSLFRTSKRKGVRNQNHGSG